MQKKWWLEKTAYQIYPKSFRDTNGDGIGDLRGIIDKLDYLENLGVEIVWLSPIYCSPLADQGYDISDYYNIDPRFGTMEDMEELIAKAKERGIGIVMDLVVNHCSDEHEWFQKACEDPDGKYGKYFYIEEMKDGKIPYNWRSFFGGKAWSPLPGHPDKCYLHLFHQKQPDLNWENKEVREEIYAMINWWLEKGLAGFRIDAIINIKKAFPFRDYPADRADGLSSANNMIADAKGIGEFLGEMRDRCFKP
ncbi:MAG: glucohydrolase, partial [Blautia sp.]|nr:glucohydrolase [Blautia sp.]